MKLLTAAEVHARSVARLGLDPEASDLSSVEALSEALRRTAGFLCPCPPRTLLRTTSDALEGLVPEPNLILELLEQILTDLTGYGDLIEERESGPDGERAYRVIYTAPPSYVPRESGGGLLIGVAPDNDRLLPEEIQAHVEHFQHVRRLREGPWDEDDLRELGLLKMTSEQWMGTTPTDDPTSHIQKYANAVRNSGPAGDVPGLLIIGSIGRYYRARWKDPSGETGLFVGRRKQFYGADLWCVVDLEEGRPLHLLDLPLGDGRGCDEAWHLQAALDLEAGSPQTYSLASGGREGAVDFFGPIPQWAQRRWDALGERVERGRGALFTYRFREDELQEEMSFMRDRMWLAEASMPEGKGL